MEKNTDKAAMKSALAMQIKAQIVGIFGVDDNTQCIAKLHSAIEIAGALSIDDLKITVTLKDLQKALEEYIKLEVDDDDE
jgi:methionine aminopeptidase